MGELGNEADRALKAMLWNKGYKPDGRPLYKYRFTEAEFERSRRLFLENGTDALVTTAGRALFLMFLAEWFRRERSSGAWGWEQPLAAAGLHYEAHARILGSHQVSYNLLRDTLEKALKYWKRPEPQEQHTKKYLWAVVSEAGFPMGAFCTENGLKRWIESALSQMFQGVAASFAVSSQSYRLTVEDLRCALYPVAVELVEALFELKRFVLKGGSSTNIDAITFLDINRPEWRKDLPVDISGNEIRTLVEETLLAPISQGAALDARRILRLRGGQWEPAIRIELEGDLPDFYLHQLSDTLDGATRARIFLRGDMAESLSRPIAVLEKCKRDDGERWECRPLSSATSFGTELTSDVALVVQVGDRSQAMVVPRGSNPITDLAIALTTQHGGEAQAGPTMLEFAPPGSLDTPSSQLYLLVYHEVEAELQFSELAQKFKVANVGASHSLFELQGEASLRDGGALIRWRTDQQQVVAQELSCQGHLVNGASPHIFRGVPQVLGEDAEMCRNIGLQHLHWRSLGKRKWFQATMDAVIGEGDLGIVTDGRLEARIRVRVIDPNTKFEFENAQGGRRLRISDSTCTSCQAWTEGLEIDAELVRGAWIVDLSHTRPGCSLKIRLQWNEASLSFHMRDTSLEKCISAANGERLNGRPKVDVSTLSSLSIWSKDSHKLLFEARCGIERFDIRRNVTGETSLAIFRREAQGGLVLKKWTRPSTDLGILIGGIYGP